MAIPDGIRRSFSGASSPTTLATSITDGDPTIQLTDGSTFPLASTSLWAAVVIDRGTTNEEKIYYSPRTANNLTNCIRGADGTIARAHSAGATVEHCLTALDINEANRHVTDTTRNDHTQYALVSSVSTLSSTTSASLATLTSSLATLTSSIATKAPIAGPTFTGTVTAPTLAVSTAATFTNSPTMPMGGTPTQLDSGVAAAGVSVKPAREDHKHAIDVASIEAAMTTVVTKAAFPVTYVRFTGTLNGSGVVAFTHGITNLHEKVVHAQAFYKGPSGESKPIYINYIDGTNIVLTSALGSAVEAASRPYRVEIMYSTTGYTWP